MIIVRMMAVPSYGSEASDLERSASGTEISRFQVQTVDQRAKC